MEINMKNVTKVGLSALAGALAFTSAHAGEISVSGSMIASYTKKGGYNNTGNPLNMNKELTFTGSGELDNGTTVAYKMTTDQMALNDSELVFTGLPFTAGGTLAMTSTGGPLDAVDNVTPTAFEEAEAAVGSIDDVSGVNGTYGIRYTLADVVGTGLTLDAMYVPRAATGDAGNEKSTAADSGDKGSGFDIVLKGPVPMVDGLTVTAGYSRIEETGPSLGDEDIHAGTFGVNYAIGGLKVGVQRGVEVDSGSNTTETQHVNDYIGVSYAVSDNLSVSYNETESRRTNHSGSSAHGGSALTTSEQDMDSISLSYTMGGMTIGILDADADNAAYTEGRTQSARAVQMTIAF
jgi:outer membrane protein OmpU